jgi:hypothetical protein
MENLFCTYNQALALKELGFKERCSHYFENNKFKIHNEISGWDFNTSFITCVSAPLKSQVFKWFRDKHNLISCIRTISYGCTIDEQEFFYEIVSVRGVASYEIYDTYEEAESACIDKLIELIKK